MCQGAVIDYFMSPKYICEYPFLKLVFSYIKERSSKPSNAVALWMGLHFLSGFVNSQTAGDDLFALWTSDAKYALPLGVCQKCQSRLWVLDASSFSELSLEVVEPNMIVACSLSNFTLSKFIPAASKPSNAVALWMGLHFLSGFVNSQTAGDDLFALWTSDARYALPLGVCQKCQ
jgi:hypothetical protein